MLFFLSLVVKHTQSLTTVGMNAPSLISSDVKMIVLCGMPGCGKTTLATSLKERGWYHVSQDILGNRRACENAARAEIAAGRRVVVDRCNQDVKQRSHWTRIAPAVVVWLDADVDLCVDRVMSRPSHPTLPPDPKSKGIIRRFASEFVPPKKTEKGVRDVLRLKVPLRESVQTLADRLSPQKEMEDELEPDEIPTPKKKTSRGAKEATLGVE